MHNMIKIIKQAAIEAVEASNPVNVLFGVISGTAPLTVRVDQRFSLSQEFLVVPKRLANTFDVGENVLLLRMQGGQRYVIFDKIGGAV